MRNRIPLCVYLVALLLALGAVAQPAWATLPTPSQPVLVVQDSASSDPYQNFVPELLKTEGLNGFQTAQLPELTAAFLANYDVVILPHLTLTGAQATLFQNYVSVGGTLVGFRPDVQLANVFGVASLGTTLSEAWLKIDTTTAYGSGLDNHVMKFHGLADMYSLNGATALATLFNTPSSFTVSPAAAIYNFGLGKSILFSFDLTQSNVLMRQGNPAWAGYPNNHDGYNTMRPPQMFMDQGTGQFWNDLGDGALSDVPQADIQLRLFSNAVVLATAAKKPLPRLWYFPNQNRAMLLMTGDHHGDDVSNSISEINTIQSFGGKFTNFLWPPFDTVDSSQVNTWLGAGHAVGIHFDDTAEVDASGVGGSAVTWNGMQNVINAAMLQFAAAFPGAPPPTTTRNHFLIWLSRNAAGSPDQTAQAKLFQNAGIELDTSYSAYPNRWGYMTGSGLPMKFLDTATGTVIPVYEQATQFEDDVQLGSTAYSTQWNLAIAQSHYQQSLSDSLTKYNTVVTMLFHPDHWSIFSGHAQTALQYAQSNSIPMYSAADWLQFWKARAATAMSMPSFSSNTLAFTATGSPAGLTLLVPNASGSSKVVSTFQVDGVPQSFTTAVYQGIVYAGIVLTAGNHDVTVTYVPAGRIMGQILPGVAAASTVVQVQGGSIIQSIEVAEDGTYAAGPFPAGTYTVSPVSSLYVFSPTSRSVTLGSSDVTSVNFTAAFSPQYQTLFTTQIPAGPFQEPFNVELGTAFTSSVPGEITGIRFWKNASDTGTHIGRIWSANGTLLASVTFSNETASGWQNQDLFAPLPILADTKYIVSYNTATGRYMSTVGGLATQVFNGNLRSVTGNNGIFAAAGQFPTTVGPSANYFADIFFLPGASSNLAVLTVNPPTVVGGTVSTGTVTLSNGAPTAGAEVTLSSDNSVVTVPATVTVPAGATSATFSVTTNTVTSNAGATLTGRYVSTRTAAVTVIPATLSSITMNPSGLVGGNSSTGTVVLTGPAPSGGVVVTLSDDSASSNTPASVTVPQGATGATFTVTTSPVASNTSVTITGIYGATRTATLAINPPSPALLAFNPNPILGGGVTTGTVTLNGAAPAGGAVVALTDDSGSATTSPSVTVSAGNTSATFNVATDIVGTATTVTVTATYNGSNAGTFVINPPVLSSVSLNPTSLTGGASSSGTVTLSSAAPAGGAVVTLSSSDPAATVPASVTVAGGTTTATFTASTVAVSSNVTATITGTFNGSQTANLTIAAPSLTSISLNPTSLVGGSSSNGTVNLSSAAPASGAVVTLSSNNASATVPATVTVPAGGTTATFTVNTVAVGSNVTATIAGDFNVSQSADLTITAPALTGISLNPTSVVGGTSSTGTLTLSSPAPAGGLSVGLSSDSEDAAVPSSVTVLAGATTAAFTVNTLAVGSNATATITGSLHGTQTATLTVTAPTLSSVSLNPTSLIGGNTSSGTVTLSSAAPAAGLTVPLSSDTTAATVPSTVTVLGGAATATFTVNTIPVAANATATITANFNGVKTAALTVNAPALASVSLNPSSLVGGNSSAGTVTLNGAAPSGGAVVALASDNAVAIIPATVTISGGATSANFIVQTTAVGAMTPATISASFNGTVTTTLTVNPAVVSSLLLNPTAVTGSTASLATVTLNGPAPAGGAVIALSSDNAAAIVPGTVTVLGGATTAIFSVGTSSVPAQTTVTISASYLGTATAGLTVNPAVVSTLSLDPTAVASGGSSVGTVTLDGPAPAGGAVVVLTSAVPVVAGVEGVTSVAGLPQGGSIDWASAGPDYTPVNSGSSFPVNGLSGVNATLSTATGLSMMEFTNCSTGGDCGWWGNFASGSSVLWMNGQYDYSTGLWYWWTPNGPLTVTFNSPQSGVGFQAMADERGLFTATLCAYNASNTLLGCVPFNGTATGTADNSAPFMGLYSDAQEISKITIDAGGVIYPHDFAIGKMFVSSARRQMLPATVTVPAGASSTTFPVTTSSVTVTTPVDITATYIAARTATLSVNPAALASVAMTPSTVLGGTALVGTATLTGSAPAGGVVVNLTADNPVSVGVQSVKSDTNLPQDGHVLWTDIGPSYTSLPSGTAVPVTGLPGTTVTVSTTNGLDSLILTNCPAIADCGWGGNFAPAAPILWVAGNYDQVGNWISNGPLTLTLNTPQRGIGFNVMADEAGNFAGTACAYNTSNTLLGCVPFSGYGAPLAGGTIDLAAYVGIYDDTAEIAKVVIDAGGPIYPHDFAIGQLFVASSRRMVPHSITVPAGAKTATFPVNTDTVNAVTTVTVTGNYLGTKTGTLIVNPPALSSLAVNPATLLGGASANGTVTLATPAPGGGAVISLSSDNAAAVVPATITIPAGTVTVLFTVTTSAVAASASTTISAVYAGVTKTAPLVVTPAALASISMNPATVTGGVSSSGTVTLTGPAPAGGVAVTLVDDSAAADTPANVTVAAGASTATFNVTTVAVGAITTVTITGNLNGAQANTLTINPGVLASVAMSPAIVDGGTSSTGTVTLTSAAPTGGRVVSLSDDSASATTPANVTVAAGATTATFTVTTVAVGTDTPLTVSAALDGVTKTAALTINAPVLSNLTMSPTSVNGGSSSTGTVTLSSVAPAGGAVVALSDDSSSSAVPASVTVLAGATTATFTVTTSPVETAATVTITGSYNGTRTATLTINAPTLTSLTLTPSALVGGNGSTGTVTLGSAAPAGGAVVTLSSNNAAATLPPSVTVSAGATTATFSVSTTGVSVVTTATITGTYNAIRTANLTINPAALTSVTMNPTVVTGGVSSTGTVTLTGLAPAGGITVTLSDNNANATTPPSVVVPQGASTANFTVTTVPVTTAASVTVTAVYSGVTRTATLTINPPTLLSVVMNPATIFGSQSSTGTVTLDSPALTGGAAITLSDNSASSSTPASVTVPAGATTANFTVTSASVATATSVTITAVRNGVTKTAPLTLNPPEVASITLNPTSVVGGLQNSTATVTLTAPAAGTATQRRVTLLSSNTNAATVPATVTVTAGATTAIFTVTSKIVLSTTTSGISGTMNGGSKSATLTVNP